MIEAYSRQFFGYGCWDAPVWFVGLEEAGAGTPEELQARLAVWDQRGRRELEDAPVFYPACGQPQWHGPNATLQPTWRQLLRMLFTARGEPVAEPNLLENQKLALCASSGSVCLTELSPMPAPNHRLWPYADHPGLPEWLRTREQFRHTVSAGRIATLRERIATHHPRAVVFYFWKPYRWDEARRSLLRAELDAWFARAYGLTRDELRYILDPADVHGPDFPGETFRVLKEKETAKFGEYRTRRLVLEAWDRLASQ